MKKNTKSLEGAEAAKQLQALEAELVKAEQAFAAGLRAGIHASCKSTCKSVKIA